MKRGVFQPAGGGDDLEERTDWLSAVLASRRVDLGVSPELLVTGRRIAGRRRDIADPADGMVRNAAHVGPEGSIPAAHSKLPPCLRDRVRL